MSPSPIALFAYNRPLHLQKTIESLILNDLAKESELFIFSDAPKNPKDDTKIQEVRNYLQKVKNEYENVYLKKIHLIFQPQNKGLTSSIISEVSQLLAQYPTIIVLEDDLICGKDFLGFMNKCLNKYFFQKNIHCISGYTFPLKKKLKKKVFVNESLNWDNIDDVFLLPRASSWGWATWADRWQKADWGVKNFQNFWGNINFQKEFNQGGEDLSVMLYKQQQGIIQSWAIRWCFNLFEQKGLCLYPKHNKIQNIGHDLSGTNSHYTTKYYVALEEKDYILPDNPKTYPHITQTLKRFFRPSFIRKVINWWKFGVKDY